MNVYCVFANYDPPEYGPDYHNLKGIFDTRMKAERRQDQLVDELRGTFAFQGMEIEEWEVK